MDSSSARGSSWRSSTITNRPRQHRAGRETVKLFFPICLCKYFTAVTKRTPHEHSLIIQRKKTFEAACLPGAGEVVTPFDDGQGKGASSGQTPPQLPARGDKTGRFETSPVPKRQSRSDQICCVFRRGCERWKKHEIKRGGRKRPPLAHKAPQCGAFYDWG